MPLYEYACPTCKARFERLRPMEGAESSPCPDCGTLSRRALSLFAVPARSTAGASEASVAACCGSGACSCAAS